MKKILKKAVVAVVAAISLISATVQVSAQDTKSLDTMTAQEIAEDMKIGWNLGNSLDCYGSGYSSTQTAETYWGNPVTTKAMIDKVKAAGFNTVRVPVTWYDKCLGDGTVDGNWLARVKEVADYGIQNDMYVIINLHHEDGGSGRSGWLIPDNSHKSACESKITSLWTQIATYFKDYDRHLIFEVMNEPRMIGTAEEWTGGTAETRAVINSLNAAAVSAVRATGGNNETRLLMCPPCAAKIDALNGFELPSDPNLAVSIHNYSPYEFAMNQYGTADWGSDSDKTALKNEITTLYNSFVSKGIPVIIGEIGATYKYNPTSDKRPAWAEYYTSAAKSCGITCIVWDNNRIDGSGENFGLLNRGSLSWYFPELTEAYVRGAGSDVNANPPAVGETDAYTNVVFEGSATAEAWAQPYKEDMSNLPELTEGCSVAVEYSGTNAPYLVFQIYDEANKQWNQLLPDYISGRVAYYSYASIVNNCQSALSSQQQMLIMSNDCTTTVTKVSVIYPHINGDVNGDAVINKFDAAAILRHIAGISILNDEHSGFADVNSDSAIDLQDAVNALNF